MAERIPSRLGPDAEAVRLDAHLERPPLSGLALPESAIFAVWKFTGLTVLSNGWQRHCRRDIGPGIDINTGEAGAPARLSVTNEDNASRTPA